MAPFTKMTEMTPDNVVGYVDSFASEVIKTFYQDMHHYQKSTGE